MWALAVPKKMDSKLCFKEFCLKLVVYMLNPSFLAGWSSFVAQPGYQLSSDKIIMKTCFVLKLNDFCSPKVVQFTHLVSPRAVGEF